MKSQVAAAYRGTGYQNKTVHLVSEYIARKRLAGLGYTSNIGQLDAFKSEAFLFIDQEIDALKSRDIKNHGRKS